MASAQQAAREPALEVIQLYLELFMIAGAGGNIAVHTGREGAVVVDTGDAQMADTVLATIKRVTPQSIRFVINTSADADRVGGNEVVSRAGQALGGNGLLRAARRRSSPLAG